MGKFKFYWNCFQNTECFPSSSDLYEVSVCFVYLNGRRPTVKMKIITPKENAYDF